MKTKRHKVYLNIFIFLLIVFVISLSGCKSNKEIFYGGRVYYDFHKKELFVNANHKKTLKRPIIMKESKEMQIEISDFNPLKYDIIIEDTAYDRFVSNVESFSKYIIIPNTPNTKEVASTKIENLFTRIILDTIVKNAKIQTELLIQKPDTNYCDTISHLIYKLAECSKDLNSEISTYKTYLTYIENINSFYELLKSKEVLTTFDIKEGIKSNIFLPINNYLLVYTSDKLETSIDKVFKKDFTAKETYFYEKIFGFKEKLGNIKEEVVKLEKILEIEKALKPNKKEVAHLEKIIKCNDFEAKITKFYDEQKVLLSTIKAFDSTRNKDILPNFTKTMLVYEKLQSLAQNEPLLVTKSYPIKTDIQTINIYKYESTAKTKQLHDAINILLTRGFRIDVSGGVFASGLYDEQYSLYSKDSIFTSEYIHSGSIRDTILKDKFTAIYTIPTKKVSFGGMIFLQGHTQNASLFNYGGYLGIGALFNDQTRWSGSFGGSFIIGRSQRLFINLGPVISQLTGFRNLIKQTFFIKRVSILFQ